MQSAPSRGIPIMKVIHPVLKHLCSHALMYCRLTDAPIFPVPSSCEFVS